MGNRSSFGTAPTQKVRVPLTMLRSLCLSLFLTGRHRIINDATFTPSGASGRLRRSGGGAATADNEALEMTIDIRAWPYLAKQGLGYLLSGVSKTDLDVGFVIEGQLDEELPEVILGAARLTKVNLAECFEWQQT